MRRNRNQNETRRRDLRRRKTGAPPLPYNCRMAKHPDALILGGGIIGLTSAYILAKAGLRVEVVDRQQLGREASWAGAGILPPFNNPAGATTPIDALRAYSMAGFTAFSAELQASTGVDNGYRVCGGIEVLHPEAAYALPLWDAEGIAYERIDGNELKRLEPLIADLAPLTLQLYHFPGFAQVRNPWHMRALIAACELEGVTLTPGCPLERWKLIDGRVRGVYDSRGHLHEAGSYLIANGAWAEDWLRPLGCEVGIHPVRGQIVLYSTSIGLSRVILDGKRYLVPRGDGRILVGSTEEPEAGFVKATTPAGEVELRRFAEGWIPALSKAVVEKTWAGLRPVSADGMPHIGPVPGQTDVFAAVGHGRAGIQLSLGTAHLVMDHMTGRSLPAYAGAFRLDRRPNPEYRPAFRS